MSAAHTDNIKT